MCGICGVYGGHKVVERVGAMLQRLAHRGPDGRGVWHERELALGHNRLAIVDLSPAGAQPMVSQDEQFVVVVNGEIYNYRELRTELEKMGHQFRSQCDSEIVIPLFRAFGVEGFKRLNGMFALAIWDRQRQNLILARDRLGIKPLYYHVDGKGHFAFASEIKGLLAAFDTDKWSIDPEGLAQFLTYQNQFGATTLFKGVKQVEPGCYLNVTSHGIRQEKYWEPTFPVEPNTITFNEAVGSFKQAFGNAVGRHLMSDVPVASYLSSGFDSSSVAAKAAELMGRPPQVFTGQFSEGGWYDEVAGAGLVAKRINAEHVAVNITAQIAAAAFDDLILALDAPQMGMGALPQYLVAKSAAQHCKVILTGHGGDELFSGYPVFKFAAFAHAFKSNLGALPKLLRSVRAAELPHLIYFALNHFKNGRGNNLMPVLFSRRLQKRVLRPQVKELLFHHNPSLRLKNLYERSSSYYEVTLRNYLQIYLPGLLVIEDKISMAHGLESRTPLLDNELVELSLSLPPSVKLDQGVLKAVLKEGVRELLPPELFHLPKRGFPTPLGRWLRGPIGEWAKLRLQDENSPLRRIFTDNYLNDVVVKYQNGIGRWWRPLDEINSHRMWMLLSLESWLRQTEERWNIKLELN